MTALNDFIQGQRDAFANVTPRHDASLTYHRGYHCEKELIKLLKARNNERATKDTLQKSI